MKTGSNKWKVKEISIEGNAAPAKDLTVNMNTSVDAASPALLAQQNWSFVEKLLKVTEIRINCRI